MTAREVAPGFPKLDKATRPWKCSHAIPTCTRAKPCNHCRGRRSRRYRRDKQLAGVKSLERQFDLSFGDFRGQRAHEENIRGPVRIEAKSGAQCKPAATRFSKSEQQSEAARPIGDNRPFAEILMPPGWGNDGIFSCRLSELSHVIEAFVNQ